MNTQERIAKINKIAEEKEQARFEAANALAQHIADLLGTIKSFAPRMHDLMDVAMALYEKGIPLGKVTDRTSGYVEFVTNGWFHNIGFVAAVRINGHIPGRGQHLPIGFGIAGGGCAGESLEINKDGELEFLHRPFGKPAGVSGRPWERKDIEHLEDFVNGFDDFERRFYEYVDSLA